MKGDLIQRALVALGFGLLALCPAQADYVFIGVPSANWGANDTYLGVAGMTIEDFEDVNLAPGLRIESSGSALGTYGPTSTLPNVFDPVNNDPFGNVFETGVWDGNHVLVNTGTNQSGSYGTSGNWADLTFYFDNGGARTVGFSLQQLQSTARVIINGPDVGSIFTLSGLNGTSGRVGYVRIEVTGDSAPISTLKIDNGSGDGFTIDHLAFSSSVNSYTFTGFGAVAWGASHATLGVSNYVEDFEDTTLLPGLQVQAAAVATGSYGPTSTLPNLFDPVNNDPNGSSYDAGVWDGAHVLVNSGNNLSAPYGPDNNWGDITLHFEGADYAGFSVENMQTDAIVLVNGTYQGKLLARSGLSTSSGRSGYVRINPTSGSAQITSVTIDNAVGDGFVIDHVAFPIPASVVNASVSGVIELEDCANLEQPITFDFRVSVGEPLVSRTVILDSSGGFTLTDIPGVEYILHVKGAKWLAKNVSVDVSPGDVTGVTAFLKAGDANDDNSADVLDLDQLIQSFDQCDGDPGFISGADLNCDGCADVLDLDLLLRNFDQVGDA